MWEPRPLTTPWATTACYRDIFIFLLCRGADKFLSYPISYFPIRSTTNSWSPRFHGRANRVRHLSLFRVTSIQSTPLYNIKNRVGIPTTFFLLGFLKCVLQARPISASLTEQHARRKTNSKLNKEILSFIIRHNTTIIKISFTWPVRNEIIGGILCYMFRFIEPSSGNIHW
jgi:hypothetical protein